MSFNNTKPTILVVDDTPDNIALLCALLGEQYRNKVATNGAKALRIAQTLPHPDLILLDIMMPEMDGYEVCRRLKEDPQTRHIPVIFLTAKNQETDETKGFELGAVDYITKPISPPVLMARVQTHLALKMALTTLEKHNETLELLVDQRTRQLADLQNAIIVSLASLSETRDNDIGNHIRNTQYYARELALQLADHPRFAHILTPPMIQTIHKTVPLHDIGKVGVPDRILLKPGKLTPDEFEEIKKHVVLGRDAILAAEQSLEIPDSFLSVAHDIIYYHHERWDGKGYVCNLAGDDIPLVARLMALVDVYDALTCRRIYKEPMTHEEARKIIVDGSGSHFDPDVVLGFLAIEEKFREVSSTNHIVVPSWQKNFLKAEASM